MYKKNWALQKQISIDFRIYKKKINENFTFSQYLDTRETQLLHKIFRKAIRVSWIHKFIFCIGYIVFVLSPGLS